MAKRRHFIFDLTGTAARVEIERLQHEQVRTRRRVRSAALAELKIANDKLGHDLFVRFLADPVVGQHLRQKQLSVKTSRVDLVRPAMKLASSKGNAGRERDDEKIRATG